MKEYRELRSKVGFMELCRRSDLAAQVTVHAAEKLGVDAAIVFSDLLVLVEPMGFKVTYAQSGGPVIENPVGKAQDVDSLREVEPEESLGYVLETIRICRRELPRGMPLIGFAGAPFTLASYLIEGKGARDCAKTRAFMESDPAAFSALLGRLADAAAGFLNAQVSAGAQAVQLFDSWVGTLSPAEYQRHVLPHAARLIGKVAKTAPLIHFGTRTGPLLELMAEAGGDVIGLDSRVDLDEAWARVPGRAVMGNMDPETLLGSIEGIRSEAARILGRARGRPGHIFNLGHGVLPATPVDNVRALVDIVHELSARR